MCKLYSTSLDSKKKPLYLVEKTLGSGKMTSAQPKVDLRIKLKLNVNNR